MTRINKIVIRITVIIAVLYICLIYIYWLEITQKSEHLLVILLILVPAAMAVYGKYCFMNRLLQLIGLSYQKLKAHFSKKENQKLKMPLSSLSLVHLKSKIPVLAIYALFIILSWIGLDTVEPAHCESPSEWPDENANFTKQEKKRLKILRENNLSLHLFDKERPEAWKQYGADGIKNLERMRRRMIYENRFWKVNPSTLPYRNQINFSELSIKYRAIWVKQMRWEDLTVQERTFTRYLMQTAHPNRRMHTSSLEFYHNLYNTPKLWYYLDYHSKTW